MYEYTVTPTKNHTFDRVFKLERIDDKAPISSTGLVDTRLFTGENKLHASIDETSLWSVSYEQGSIPEVLRKKFTTLNRLIDYMDDYFKKRNIKITEISD